MPGTVHVLSPLILFFSKDFIYFQREGKGGRMRGRGALMSERSNWLPFAYPQLGTWSTTQACVLTRNQTGTQSTEPHHPGLSPLILKPYEIHIIVSILQMWKLRHRSVQGFNGRTETRNPDREPLSLYPLLWHSYRHSPPYLLHPHNPVAYELAFFPGQGSTKQT